MKKIQQSITTKQKIRIKPTAAGRGYSGAARYRLELPIIAGTIEEQAEPQLHNIRLKISISVQPIHPHGEQFVRHGKDFVDFGDDILF